MWKGALSITSSRMVGETQTYEKNVYNLEIGYLFESGNSCTALSHRRRILVAGTPKEEDAAVLTLFIKA